MSSLLRPAQAISVEVQNRTYEALVLRVHEPVEIVVQAPQQAGRPLCPPVNAPARIVVHEPAQPLTFLSRVLRCAPCGDVAHALYLAWPEAADRTRRRRHVRADVMVKAQATPLPRQGEAVRPLNALTADISEGGVRLTVADAVEVGALVHLRLYVRPGETIECAGQVVRAGRTEQMLAPHAYWIAIEFVDLPEATRTEIAQLS